MTSVETAHEPRAPGPGLRVAVVLIVAGFLLAIPTLVAGVVPIVREVTASSRFDAPGQTHLHLGRGTYMVYEDVGASSIGSPFSSDDNVTITPDDVTVTGDDGASVAVSERGTTRESLSSDGDSFVGAVRFTTPASGGYTVSVRNITPKEVLVARPLTDTIRSVLVWLLLAGVGGVVLVVGIILLIVGSVRRNRMRTAFAYAAPPPAGWHPDPAGSGRWRYWDGYRWTDHVQ